MSSEKDNDRTRPAVHEIAVKDHILAIEGQIRAQPADAALRWALFQWLCVARTWDRAIRQLQVFGQLDASSMPIVHACRDLVKAERWREDVMLGKQSPGCFVDGSAGWMRDMIAALALDGRGDAAAADDLRERALDAAPLVAGQAGDIGFEWIGDSDSRFGPIFEVIAAGSYRWISFSDIKAWSIAKPATLLDLVWARLSLTLSEGTVVRGFTPARYPSLPGSESDDTLELGRQTAWHETGRSRIIATGRKAWNTSAGDVSLFEWPECALGDAAETPAAPDSDAIDAAVAR